MNKLGEELCVISIIFKNKHGLYSSAVEIGTLQCFENTIKMLKEMNIEIPFNDCTSESQLAAEGISLVEKYALANKTINVATFFINKSIKLSRRKGNTTNVVSIHSKDEVEIINLPSNIIQFNVA